MKTLTCRESWAPLRNLLVASWSSVKRTPGARLAKARKLRLLSGSASICCGVTLVASCESLVSTSSCTASPNTVTCSVTSWFSASENSTCRFWPRRSWIS